MAAIPLTQGAVRAVKRWLSKQYPEVKSSHLSEAIAAACGRNTHAALRAAIREQSSSDPEIVLMDELSFLRRLEEMNVKHAVAKSFVPAFDLLASSELPEIIKTTSAGASKVDYSKSKRKRAWRNAMVTGINEGIEKKLFSVRPDDNRWPTFGQGKGPYVYRFSVSGVPGLASVSDAGYGELSFRVALWPTPEGERWIRAWNSDFLAGEAYAGGWLERRNGAWLQVTARAGGGSSFACRSKYLDTVASLNVRPKGYSDRGSFML